MILSLKKLWKILIMVNVKSYKKRRITLYLQKAGLNI